LACGGPAIISLVGIDTAVFGVVALSASLSPPLKEMWMRIAMRYADSCISALGFLLVGWSIPMMQLALRSLQKHSCSRRGGGFGRK